MICQTRRDGSDQWRHCNLMTVIFVTNQSVPSRAAEQQRMAQPTGVNRNRHTIFLVSFDRSIVILLNKDLSIILEFIFENQNRTCYQIQ